jgi:hypothetical protein
MWGPGQLFGQSEQGVWYDPSDFSTMWQDSAGTTPVTAVEQPVGKILDKSGRGNHATQATAASRPVLKQDANGKYYLFFDGVDDSLATASIDFTATDKMSVFAGVRKLSDAAIGMVLELSVNSGLNNGAFDLLAPATVGATYGTRSRGTVSVDLNTSASYPAPQTAVLSELADISAPFVKLRLNSTIQTQNLGSQGTGNYGNYTLYVGSRAGTSLPFNGNLYSLIIRGAASSASQIAAAEAFVNSKTGAY